MSLEIRAISEQEIEAVRQLLASNGWAHRVTDSASFELLINNSDCCIVALKNDAVVGFARGITDHLSNGYISMVVVASECRRQSIGRKLVATLTTENRDITWVLRASRDGAKEFFAHLGFMPATDAMELRRR
jgi:ribosomal protein S18 acetylase RimI-like enzyme